MPYDKIAKSINKTRKQVQTYAKQIGLIEDGKLKKTDSFKTNKKLVFTEEEVEYLKNNFNVGLDKLEEKLTGRTKQQIYSKIKKMGLLNRKQTFPEMCVESILKSLNLKFEKEFIMKNCERKFIIDFLVEDKYAIEVQGEYWHAHNKEINLTKAQEKNVLRDKLKYDQMIKCGYKVLYLWENEIKNDKDNYFSNCKEVIKKFIDAHNKHRELTGNYLKEIDTKL